MDLNAILQTAPILVDLLTRGLLRVESDGAIIGEASDGVTVCVGSEHEIASTESYLKAHPTPDTW
jgi:hypothetical protein